jgi:hypothetical protein
MTVDPTLAPERIFLLLHEGEGGSHVWCDQPDPTGNGEHDAVEYVRLDVATAWIQAAIGPRASLALAVLMFHRGGPWTNTDRATWRGLTGRDEATTKVLCDLARRGLP